MCDQDVGYDLESDGLQCWMAFGEAMQEEGKVLFGKVLVSVLAGYCVHVVPWDAHLA